MKKDISYNEILIMYNLSKLIYDYHKNDDFDLQINETIYNYLSRINNNNNLSRINNNDLFEIKNTLTFLSNTFPYAFIYNFISNKNTDIQAGIILNNNCISIVFRGTDTITDWLYDFDFIKRHIELNDIEIHKGFYDQLMSIYDEILNNINIIILSKPYLEIYITGHSAGAAQGTILSYLLSKIYKNKIIKLITFGSPKVGNYEWYKHFNKINNIIYYRISNEGDIVTKIPNINYYHVGINIHLTNNNMYYNNDNGNDIIIEDDTNCLEQYNCFDYNLVKCKYLNINNHKIKNYYINLKDKEDIFNNL